jgi:adenylosuccinate lyase
MEAVKAGAGREEAHEAIKEHAVAAVLDLRSGAIKDNDLVVRLAADSRLGLTNEQLSDLTERAQAMTGLATGQVDNFCTSVRKEALNVPAATSYTPSAIL